MHFAAVWDEYLPFIGVFAYVISSTLHGRVLLFFAAVVCVSMCSTLFLSHQVQVSGVRVPVLRFFRLSS